MRSSAAWARAIGATCMVMCASANAEPAGRLMVEGKKSCGLLLSPDQLDLERTAKTVGVSAALRREKVRLARLYRADPQGRTSAGRATIKRAVSSIANAAVQYIVNNPARSRSMWVTKAPLQADGISIPRSGYGIDNPDNVYRNIPIDASSSYEISGAFGPHRPIQLHFTLMDGIPGTRPLTAEGGGFVGTLSSDEMEVKADGSFTVSIGPDPSNGRPNHIQSRGSGELLLVVRDLFTDWAEQQPARLIVRKIGGPDVPAPSLSELSQRSADLLSRIGPYWLAYDNQYIFSKPANTFAAPRPRPGGRGLSLSSWFHLGHAEALLVTLDSLGAKSLGFQLTDPWGVAYEYVSRTSSLNNAQAQPNPDGTFTFVISAQDPGAANWLDPSGYDQGIMTVRWQGLPENVRLERAVREVRKIALPLPSGIAMISPEARRTQQRMRASSYWTRTFGARADCTG